MDTRELPERTEEKSISLTKGHLLIGNRKNGLVSRPGVEVVVRHHVDRPHQGIHPSIVVKDPNNQCLFGVPITGLSLGSC